MATQNLKTTLKGAATKSAIPRLDSASIIESAKSSLANVLEDIDYEAAIEKLEAGFEDAKTWAKKHPVATFVGAAFIGYVGMKIFAKATEKVGETTGKLATKAGKKVLN